MSIEIPDLRAPLYADDWEEQCPHCMSYLTDEKYWSDHGPGPFDCDNCGKMFFYDYCEHSGVMIVPLRSRADLALMEQEVDAGRYDRDKFEEQEGLYNEAHR